MNHLLSLGMQDRDYQREGNIRFHLLFGDQGREFLKVITLSLFSSEGKKLIKRLALVLENGRISKCLYPVFRQTKTLKRVFLGLRAQVDSRQFDDQHSTSTMHSHSRGFRKHKSCESQAFRNIKLCC